MALPEAYRKGRVSVGVIPIGTGNDFIRNFGKAADFMDIHAQLNGTPVQVDAISFNQRYAANMLNIGFDCQVVKKVEELRGNFFMRKGIAYPIGVACTLLRFPHAQIKLTFDDGEIYEGRFLLSFVANGCYCGGGFKSASEAKQDDGLLDVMMVKPISRLKFISLIGKYKKGTLLGTRAAKKYILYKQCKSVTVEAVAGEDVCIDGEVEPFGKLQIQAEQKVYYFSVPSQAASVIKGSLAR
jgi:diacylglycerol kinase family enzyme